MPVTTSIIETGVDKLINLVKERGRIAIQDAAKELGVSVTVIQEWTDFLEDEGIINIEYKFTKPYLVERKLTKKEVEAKAKEFTGKKDVFVRKAEVTLGFLEREADKLKLVKVEFDKLRNELGFDFDKVGKELNELHKYEQLKINLDKQVQQQKEAAKEKINELSQHIIREQRKYQELLSDIQKEKLELDKEKQETLSVEVLEKSLKDRIANLKRTINKIEARVNKEDETIKNSEKHIERLNNLIAQMKLSTEREKGLIDNLVNKSRVHNEKIMELQNKIIEKILEKEKKLEKAKKVASKFKIFFDNKMKVINMINKINSDRDALEKELIGLIKKAKSFQLSSKSANVGKEVLELEKKFNEIDDKKKNFEEDYKKLISAINA